MKQQQQGLNIEDEEPKFSMDNVHKLIDSYFDKCQELNVTFNELLTANAIIAATVTAHLAKESEAMEETYKQLLDMQKDRMNAMIDDISYLLGEQELEMLKTIAGTQEE